MTNTPLTVTSATKADLKEFQLLFNEFQEHHFRGESDFFVNPKIIHFTLEDYAQLIKDPQRHVFLLWKDNLCIGMLLISVVKVPVGELQYPRTRPTIEMLIVREKYRKLGGGKMLVEAAYHWAREEGYDEVVTDVWEFSKDALTFFRDKEHFATRSVRFYKKLSVNN